jgi:nucleotide-binding universal stress UspA family protein
MSSQDNVIVVGIDDSPSSRAAIRWAADYARATGCRLQAVHVLILPPATEIYAHAMEMDEVYPDADYVEERYRTASQALFDAVNPEPDWELQYAQGHAGRILVELSRTARLLVVGAREHHGVGRLLNGSIGHYCLNHATCPVMSVPPRDSALIASMQVRQPALHD